MIKLSTHCVLLVLGLCPWRGKAYAMRVSSVFVPKVFSIPNSIHYGSIIKKQANTHHTKHRTTTKMKAHEEVEHSVSLSSLSSLFSRHGRRSTIRFITIQTLAFITANSQQQQPLHAQITEESKTFFSNTAADANDSSSLYLTNPTESSSSSVITSSLSSPSDEISISIPLESLVLSQKEGGGGLGIELADIEFRTNRRVYIKSIRSNSLASLSGIQKDWIFVSINGQSTERTDAQGVAIMISKVIRSILDGDSSSITTSTRIKPTTLDIIFRDPYLFQQRLNNLSSSSSSSTTNSVTTQVAPEGDTTQRNIDGSIKVGNMEKSQTNQRVTVTELIPPKLCRRKAQVDDLLEISYLGTVLDSGEIFDGSAIKINGQGIPGRGNDVSLYFVLGKQPFGQFPVGWDVGLVGMCVGERRRLILPPALAYGSTGIPRRGIPPNATLQYDITLVSINGLAVPQ